MRRKRRKAITLGWVACQGARVELARVITHKDVNEALKKEKEGKFPGILDEIRTEVVKALEEVVGCAIFQNMERKASA